jgi:hypothetical protein
LASPILKKASNNEEKKVFVFIFFYQNKIKNWKCAKKYLFLHKKTMMKIDRKPAVAGQFYTADAIELKKRSRNIFKNAKR